MTGIEMMFAKMLGLEPAQLKEMATGFVETVKSINTRLQNIETIVARLDSQNTVDDLAERKDAA
jgi:hypothetical protein